LDLFFDRLESGGVAVVCSRSKQLGDAWGVTFLVNWRNAVVAALISVALTRNRLLVDGGVISLGGNTYWRSAGASSLS
jgi:hypothetical protein